MSEHVEESIEPPLTEQDQADLAQLYGEPDGVEAPQFHPILEVWAKVLEPAAAEGRKPVTPQWANRMVAEYRELRFCDTPQLRDYYFGKIGVFNRILLDEIASDPDCLSYATPEEDVAENSHHYKNLLLTWQMQMVQWEIEWDPTADDAGIELAAISEIHKMFFGQMGLTAFLDNIKFEFTEDDQAQLAEALNDVKISAGVAGE
jgi:hypothetical protein